MAAATFSLLSPNRTIMREPSSIATPAFLSHDVPEATNRMERTLDQVRRDIDDIDTSIQDLLIRRTELVEEVRAIKQDWRVKIEPSREAEILYRLIDRHSGAFPRRDLVAIWRISSAPPCPSRGRSQPPSTFRRRTPPIGTSRAITSGRARR